MKSFKKVIAVLLTAVLLLSTASCVPVSLTKQWSYKYSDDVLTTQQDIGVYIYALYQAYNQAANYAKDAEGYVENKPFTDLKITDDDGNTAVASEWIKSEAEKIAMNTIATDYYVAEYDVTWDAKAMSSAKKTAQDTWDMGPYASYGYYMPMSDELEPYGVSFNSFFTATYESEVKQSALFEKIYGKDGVEEVSDKDLEKYFTKNYVAYSYVPVNLYKTSTDADGNNTNTTFNKKKTNTIKADVEAMANSVNNDSVKASKAIENLAKEYKVEDSSVVKNTVELLTATEENNEDIAKALKKLKAGKATAITVDADSDTPAVYLIIRHDINSFVDSYVKGDAANRPSVLSSYKGEDFVKFVEDKAAELLKSDKLEANTFQLDRYKADMFYVEPEKETDAEDAT